MNKIDKDYNVVHIMIDIETLALGADAAILSIGATTFAWNWKYTDRALYKELNSGSYRFYDRVNTDWYTEKINWNIDKDTLNWWDKEENKSAAKESLYGTATLPQVLEHFSNWMRATQKHFPDSKICVWAKGANFDIAILEYSYRKLSLPVPWHYRNIRCLRTIQGEYPGIFAKAEENIKDWVPDELEESKCHPHVAIYDACWQAEIMKVASEIMSIPTWAEEEE